MSEKKSVSGSKEGLKNLEDELYFRRGERQAQIAEEMGKAIEQGDLRENAAYDEARRAMWDNNSRIAELEEIITNYTVVDTSKSDGSYVTFGAHVTLKTAQNTEVNYMVVGSQESDIFSGKISNESPLGAALMGKRVGESVEITTHKGLMQYTLLAISMS